MARDATARLYDVDYDSFVYKRLRLTEKYDQATITFQARRNRLIDLDKLHESIWATRLSGGTNSGVICLEVTVAGDIGAKELASNPAAAGRTVPGATSASESQIVLKVRGADRQFLLVDDVRAKPPDGPKSSLTSLREAWQKGERITSVTGFVDGWSGRWPTVLSRAPEKRPQLMVTSFEREKKSEQ